MPCSKTTVKCLPSAVGRRASASRQRECRARAHVRVSTRIALFTELAMKQRSCAKVVQRFDRGTVWLHVAAERDARPQHDRLRPVASVRDSAHRADGFVFVAVDDETLLGCEREEPQHVAARNRRNERFLGVDAGRIRQRRAHDRRRRRCRNDGAAVEAPFVRARVAVAREVGVSPRCQRTVAVCSLMSDPRDAPMLAPRPRARRSHPAPIAHGRRKRSVRNDLPVGPPRPSPHNWRSPPAMRCQFHVDPCA